MAAIAYPTRTPAPAPVPHPAPAVGAPASVPRARRPQPARAVYRRRRLVAAAVAVVVLVAAAGLVVGGARAVWSGLAAPVPAAGGVELADLALVSGESVVVRAGDTLWSIARRIQPTGDLRPLVHELSELNGGPHLEAGDVLAVP